MRQRSRLYSQTPIFAIVGYIAIGTHTAEPLIRFLVLHKPMGFRFRDNSLLTGMRAGKRKSHKAESGLCFPVSGMFHKTSNEVKQLGAFTAEHRSWRLEAIDIHVLISHMASSFTHCQIYSFYGSSRQPSSHSSVIYAGIPSWPWKIAQLSFLVYFQWQILL